ncbi:MAG TPA: SDR family NAD(P)-dependent oxidoreductase [Acidimicrobiales bacterium]
MDPSIIDAFDLSGRVAVITGAGGGIGREAAIVFAGAGARVVVGDIVADGLFETVRLVEANGGRAIAVPTDVTKRDQVEALVHTANREFGSVDVMANVAGIIRNNTVIDTPEEELDAVIAVNLKGVYFGCQAAARVMVEQGSGSIINVASAGMDMAVPGLSAYALTKAAVAMLTRTLATEVGPHGVRVNSLAPGFTDTPMTQRWWKSPDGFVNEAARDELWRMRADQSPLHRIGTARDQALGMLYLASDASSFMTGQVLRINGGVVMP